ncbi:ParA/MinD ATPase like [Nesidiocoris tenuis]|uniref:ParA/MinD ATPase like n=1 Tax=Nesidiocoris tenuis TaxID=355587 RepID=A0ABN7APT3_9HEMI|nr:ParA/MinD ATPase like [Nesidiocoris tenuis]
MIISRNILQSIRQLILIESCSPCSRHYGPSACQLRQKAILDSCQKSYFSLGTSAFNSPNSEDVVKKRQAELMAKGLPKKKAIPGVKDIILVVSAKGGVGKSTVAVNVASALARGRPSKIGLLDADIFGPSIPLMMNFGDLTPEVNKDNHMIPLVNYGVKCMSMGFLLSESSAVIWRGLMVMKALEQMTRQVDWTDTECLIVDTPPGTGDTLLSLFQTVPVSGVVMVTTPETLALQVARRGATMIQKLGVPIVGIVSNMSSVICNNCHTDIPIFGDGSEKLAADLGVPLITEIPLTCERDAIIKPAIVQDPNSFKAQKFLQIANFVENFLSSQNNR